jgi:succinate dehydrogenase / fumarate reductase membrane anchor subunit
MVARTPLARIRGLGATGTGTREYWLLKLTSIALLPLTLFLIGLAVALKHADHAEVASTLAAPYVAIPLCLFLFANAVHMRHGMQNVIDDYVHAKGLKKIAIVANIFFSYGASAVAFYFLLQLGFGN